MRDLLDRRAGVRSEPPKNPRRPPAGHRGAYRRRNRPRLCAVPPVPCQVRRGAPAQRPGGASPRHARSRCSTLSERFSAATATSARSRSCGPSSTRSTPSPRASPASPTTSSAPGRTASRPASARPLRRSRPSSRRPARASAPPARAPTPRATAPRPTPRPSPSATARTSTRASTTSRASGSTPPRTPSTTSCPRPSPSSRRPAAASSARAGSAGGTEVEWNMVPFDVQWIGGITLHQGSVAEMKTGEGKTLTSVAPIYLNALVGRGVHVVTVNPYLAVRDSEWMAPVFAFHGLSVDCIDKHQPQSPERRAAYRADITYGTNNEFGFDYLRDNSFVSEAEQLSQRGHHFAIVDEVDSVLIDEARTPLIISGPVPTPDTDEYQTFQPLVDRLVREQQRVVAAFVADAERALKMRDELLAAGDKKGASRAEREAGLALLRAERGFPKNKRLIKVKGETGVAQLIQKTEFEYLQDNAKRMPEVDEPLFFALDEKLHQLEMTDKGRTLIGTQAGTDDRFFVIPDVGEEVARIERQYEEDKEDALAAVMKRHVHPAGEPRRRLPGEGPRPPRRRREQEARDLHRLRREVRAHPRRQPAPARLHALREGHRVHRAGRQGDDRRRAHGPRPRRAPLLGRPAPGDRGQGAREGPGGDADLRDRHDPELLPPLLEARRHDRHGRDRGRGVLQDLQAPRRRHPDEPADRPGRHGGPHLQDEARQVQRAPPADRGHPRHGPADAYRHGERRDVASSSRGCSRTPRSRTTSSTRSPAARRPRRRSSRTPARSAPSRSRPTWRAAARTSSSRRACRSSAGSPSSGRSATTAAASTSSCAAAPAARATPARASSTSRSRTTSCASSATTGRPRSWTASAWRRTRCSRTSGSRRASSAAQGKVEQNNFAARKRQLEYDDVLNSQREVIYDRRMHALEGERLKGDILDMLRELAERTVKEHYRNGALEEIRETIMRTLAFDLAARPRHGQPPRRGRRRGVHPQRGDGALPPQARRARAAVLRLCPDDARRHGRDEPPVQALRRLHGRPQGPPGDGHAGRRARARRARRSTTRSSARPSSRSSTSAGRSTSATSTRSRRASACGPTARRTRSSSTRWRPIASSPR